jgi:hypothetical protein
VVTATPSLTEEGSGLPKLPCRQRGRAGRLRGARAEILGAKIADSEDEGFWSGLFDELKGRGLEGVKMQELAAELNQKRHSKSANTME